MISHCLDSMKSSRAELASVFVGRLSQVHCEHVFLEFNFELEDFTAKYALFIEHWLLRESMLG